MLRPDGSLPDPTPPAAPPASASPSTTATAATTAPKEPTPTPAPGTGAASATPAAGGAASSSSTTTSAVAAAAAPAPAAAAPVVAPAAQQTYRPLNVRCVAAPISALVLPLAVREPARLTDPLPPSLRPRDALSYLDQVKVRRRFCFRRAARRTPRAWPLARLRAPAHRRRGSPASADGTIRAVMLPGERSRELRGDPGDGGVASRPCLAGEDCLSQSSEADLPHARPPPFISPRSFLARPLPGPIPRPA